MVLFYCMALFNNFFFWRCGIQIFWKRTFFQNTNTNTNSRLLFYLLLYRHVTLSTRQSRVQHSTDLFLTRKLCNRNKHERIGKKQESEEGRKKKPWNWAVRKREENEKKSKSERKENKYILGKIDERKTRTDMHVIPVSRGAESREGKREKLPKLRYIKKHYFWRERERRKGGKR